MLLTLALLAAPTPDVLDVHPVNGPYTEIVDAVFAADEGDVVRVAPGTYGSFAIRGKSVTVTAPAGATVNGVVRVQELGPAQSATVQNLTIGLAPGQFEERLIVGLNAGSVRLDGIHIPPATPGFHLWVNGGARVVSSADVVMTSCSAFPSTFFDSVFDALGGGPGLECRSSNISLFDCEFAGAGHFDAQAGIVARDCRLHAFSVQANGGNGGSATMAFTSCQGVAGAGGDGISALDCDVVTMDCNLTGGFGGFEGCFGASFNYADGEPVGLTGTSTHIDLVGAAPRLVAPEVVYENSSLILTATSDPSDLLVLIVGSSAARIESPASDTDLLIGDFSRARNGVVAAGGATSVPLTDSIGSLPPFAATELHYQVVHLRPNASAPSGREILFGPPRVVTVIDSVY